MGKIMEAIFCVFYLIFTVIVGFQILSDSKSKKAKTLQLYGIMALVLVFGDAFHLVPRILAVINSGKDYTAALGYGKLITSITMTIFYLILYFIFELLYEKKSTALRLAMGILQL